MVHMKGFYGRPREIEDRKYGMFVCVCVPQSLLSSLLIMCCTTTIKKRTKDNQKWVCMWFMEDRKGVTRMTLITTEEHR